MRDKGSRVYLRSPIHLHYVDINNSAQKCRPSRASLCTSRPRDASVLACLRNNGGKKKKKSRETKLSAQKKKDDDLCPPLSLIFIYLNTFRFSVRETAIRAQFANRQKRLYLRLYLYVESIFCNYAIGSRNFSSGIILTRVFRRWNDSGEINLRR